MWLECIGVVSGCFKEVYRFLHNITYPYSICIIIIALFAAISLPLCSFFKCFFVLVMIIVCMKSLRPT